MMKIACGQTLNGGYSVLKKKQKENYLMFPFRSARVYIVSVKSLGQDIRVFFCFLHYDINMSLFLVNFEFKCLLK